MTTQQWLASLKVGEIDERRRLTSAVVNARPDVWHRVPLDLMRQVVTALGAS